MALGDIELLSSKNGTGYPGAQKYAVAASATLINAGEPVGIAALGDAVVIPMATNQPAINTHLGVGVATTTSTNTAGAAGVVSVVPMDPNDVWLIKPNSAAAFDTQAEYDALVGDRVLIDLTTGSYTILATDSANNGCTIMPLDISKYPNAVAFSFRGESFYKA